MAHDFVTHELQENKLTSRYAEQQKTREYVHNVVVYNKINSKRWSARLFKRQTELNLETVYSNKQETKEKCLKNITRRENSSDK